MHDRLELERQIYGEFSMLKQDGLNGIFRLNQEGGLVLTEELKLFDLEGGAIYLSMTASTLLSRIGFDIKPDAPANLARTRSTIPS